MSENDKLSKAMTDHDKSIAQAISAIRETMEGACADIKKLENILNKGYK